MKRFHDLLELALLPVFVVSCAPYVHRFEPRIHGHLVSSAQNQRKLLEVVQDTALRRGYAPRESSDEILSFYEKRTASGDINLQVSRGAARHGAEVSIVDWTSTKRTREARELEREIRASFR